MTNARRTVRTENSRWDVVPMPPNTYEKSVSWSREVTVVSCAVHNCGAEVDEERVLCNPHFYELLTAVKEAAAQDSKLRERMERTN